MLNTVWEIRTYDVWGNAEDGYEVNDAYVIDRHYELAIPVSTYNKGKEAQFSSAAPTDNQLRDMLNIKPTCKIETDGDDLTIYVNRSRDNYPIGEVRCISHRSLSPIRSKEAQS